MKTKVFKEYLIINSMEKTKEQICEEQDDCQTCPEVNCGARE